MQQITLTEWVFFGLFLFIGVGLTGFLVFKADRKGEEEETVTEAMLKDLRDFATYFLHIGRFFWRPFTDAYKVAINNPEVLPARRGIGWLAGLSVATYFAIAVGIYREKWQFVVLCIGAYVVLYVIRTYIWTIIDLRKDVDKYFGDGP